MSEKIHGADVETTRLDLDLAKFASDARPDANGAGNGRTRTEGRDPNQTTAGVRLAVHATISGLRRFAGAIFSYPRNW